MRARGISVRRWTGRQARPLNDFAVSRWRAADGHRGRCWSVWPVNGNAGVCSSRGDIVGAPQRDLTFAKTVKSRGDHRSADSPPAF